MRLLEFFDLLRPKERVALGIVFATLLFGVVRSVVVGSEGASAVSAEVAAELQRRAEAGDPVAISDRQWPAGQAGVDWRDFDSEPRFAADLLHDPSSLLQGREGWATAADERGGALLTREVVEQCVASDRSPGALEARAFENERLRRDPALWREATESARAYRAFCAFVMIDGREDASACDLRVPPGEERLRAELPNVDEVDPEPTMPPPDWFVGQAEPRLAAADWAALRGDAAGATRALRETLCLLRTIRVPVLNEELYSQRLLVERVLRQAEACAPLLGDEGAELLADIVAACPERSHVEALGRVLRGERAVIHADYAEFTSLMEGLPSEFIDVEAFGGAPARWSPGAGFLQYLEDGDEALAAIASPYDRAVDRLRALQSRRIDAIESGADFGYLDWVVFPLAESAYGDVVRLDALTACASVGAEAAAKGADAGLSAAAAATDPFSGGALHARVRDDGVFEVWSVGDDQVDDGGHTARERRAVDLDVVVRVQLPESSAGDVSDVAR